MSSQLIVQWNYVIHFDIRGSFFNNFCSSFWKRVHNSKEIVNLQGLFVLTVGYVDMKTYPLTKYNYIRLFYIAFVLTIHKRSRFEPAPPSPQSTICSYAPASCMHESLIYFKDLLPMNELNKKKHSCW